MLDLDVADTAVDMSQNIWAEYTYAGTEQPCVAITDYKRVVKGKTQLVLGQLPTRRWIANRCKVPFFITLTFLDPDYDVKMYYVIPSNELARTFFSNRKLSLNGEWLTLKMYSQFQYQLRGKKWNGESLVDLDTIRAIKSLDPAAPVEYGMTLKKLPNKKVAYELPSLTHLEER